MDRQDAYCADCVDEHNGAIRLCLIHAAAPALLAACETVLATLQATDADGDETTDGRTVGDILIAVIHTAKGERP